MFETQTRRGSCRSTNRKTLFAQGPGVSTSLSHAKRRPSVSRTVIGLVCQSIWTTQAPSSIRPPDFSNKSYYEKSIYICRIRNFIKFVKYGRTSKFDSTTYITYNSYNYSCTVVHVLKTLSLSLKRFCNLRVIW